MEYLDEALASERRLARALERSIELAPNGDYRRDLLRHLRETREHAHLVGLRLQAMGHGGISIKRLLLGAAREAYSMARAPFARPPHPSPDEVLGAAKEGCATEAHQIAIYTAIERLARRIGDRQTADLAVGIRAQEEEMLLRTRRHVAPLTDAVVATDVRVDANHQSGVHTVDVLSDSEPWPGYDALNVRDLRSRLADGDPLMLHRVRVYERAHKARASILDLTERKTQRV